MISYLKEIISLCFHSKKDSEFTLNLCTKFGKLWGYEYYSLSRYVSSLVPDQEIDEGLRATSRILDKVILTGDEIRILKTVLKVA